MRAFARPSSLDTGWHGLTLSPPRTAFGKELLIEANETKKSLPSLPLFPSVQGIRAGADEGFWNRSTRRAQSCFLRALRLLLFENSSSAFIRVEPSRSASPPTKTSRCFAGKGRGGTGSRLTAARIPPQGFPGEAAATCGEKTGICDCAVTPQPFPG